MASRPLHALGQLIHEVQQANGWSYADISANAGKAGRSLSRSRVESLRNDPLTSIGIKAIESLAAGLLVPPGRVVAAAVESMGYAAAPHDTAGSVAEALENDQMLSAPARRILLAALEAAHAEYESASGPRKATQARRRGRSTSRGGNRIADVAADEG